jgi:hypothetical protein
MHRKQTFLSGVLVLALGFTLAAEAKKKQQPDPAMIAARSKIFGTDNVNQKTGAVDPTRVIFSWITNATFAASANGHVMLLDTFVTRLEIMPGRTPIVIQDLVDMQPEALLLGHGHFDHADNAAYLAQETGATIYASPETCDNMAIDATNNFDNGYTLVKTVSCVSLTSRGSLPGKETVKINQFEPDISIDVFKHLHSTNTGANDPDATPVAATAGGVCTPTATKGNTFPCNLPDPRDAQLFPAGVPLANFMNIATSRAGAGGPLAMFFVFTVHGPNEFKFVWHNSTGDIVDSCGLPNNVAGSNPPVAAEPGQLTTGCFPNTVKVAGKTVGANLASIMDGLGPVDVEMGSVVSLGFNQNGERDIVSYISHIKPKVFIPNHVTAVAVEGSSLEWKVGFIDALRAASSVPLGTPNANGADYNAIPEPNWPETPWLVDPNDYLRPLVFTPSDARWKK